MQGVEHAKKTLVALGELCVDGIAIVRSGAGLGSIKKMFEVVEGVKVLIDAAPRALPELADLDAKECAELGATSYQVVRRIVEAARA